MNSQQWPPARAKIQQHTDRRARNLTTLSTQGRSQLYRATRAWRDSSRESSFRSITPNASSFQVNPMGFLCTSTYSSIYIICHIHVYNYICALCLLDHCTCMYKLVSLYCYTCTRTCTRHDSACYKAHAHTDMYAEQCTHLRAARVAKLLFLSTISIGDPSSYPTSWPVYIYKGRS